MKKTQTILLFILISMLLIACGDGKQTAEENNENNLQTNNGANNNEINDNEEHEKSNNEVGNNDDESLETDEEVIEAKYRVNEKSVIEPIEDANEKVALLTIDDAPDKYSLEMAQTLKSLEANAIFFVNGHFIEHDQNRQMLKEIYDLGFIIGNHTYSHKNLKDLTDEETREEIIRVNDMVEEIIGERPKFFRAPFGVYTDYAKEVIEEEGMVLMNWTYGYDYFEPYMNKDRLVEAMVSGKGPEVGVEYSLLNNGANLLMHDREWTNDGLYEIVTGLREKGYEIVDPIYIETK